MPAETKKLLHAWAKLHKLWHELNEGKVCRPCRQTDLRCMTTRDGVAKCSAAHEAPC